MWKQGHKVDFMTLLPHSKSKISGNYNVNTIGWRCIKMFMQLNREEGFKRGMSKLLPCYRPRDF